MKVITIGRSDEGNDVIINDPMVSRHHFQIVQDDDGSFRLADFGSTNGTYINGQKVSGEVGLDENDIIRVGNTTIPWRHYFDSNYGGFPETEQPFSTPYSPSNVTSVEKQRHGFVTFWLWFGIIANLITIPFSIIAYQRLSNLGYLGIQLLSNGVDISPFSEAIGPHVLIMQIIAAIAGIALIVCYAMILNWKRSGFWGTVVVGVVVAIVNVIMLNLIKQDYALIGLSLNMNPIIQVISTPISLVVLWAILQIKKDGVSCWKQLE